MAGWLVVPALAAQDPAAMNEVSRAWDRYAALSSQEKAESVDLLAASSLVHFGFLRDMALYASPDQLRRLPSGDRIVVYLLRATQQPAALKAMDNRAVARLCMVEGWSGVDEGNDERPILSLSNVTVIDDLAVGEVAPPTESQFQFGPVLVREDGQWRYRYESMMPDVSAFMDQAFKQSALGDVRSMELALANMLEDEAPSLALLDRTPLDDAAMRTRLNEAWPDYAAPLRWRLRAVRSKAEAGDGFAQFVIGALQYGGGMAQFVPKNTAEGLTWLEKASEGGHGQAAWLASVAITEEGKYSDDAMQRALPHVKRAAAQGVEPQALLAMAQYHHDGLAGMARDCQQAEEWAARAEEAGAKQARNERVWILATCPVPGQREAGRALELAQFMIQRKDELGWHELDTVAAALAASGDFTRAVQFQTLAIEKMTADADVSKDARGPIQKRMKARLGKYRSGHDYVVDYRAIDEMRASRH
ncbi:hypothetical protein ASD72_03430 [Pseudoxanthomonas sp. Root630]|nr:hypothetical protein ASD72_03430 [Pseudoxanthomonas sp. Root630]